MENLDIRNLLTKIAAILKVRLEIDEEYTSTLVASYVRNVPDTNYEAKIIIREENGRLRFYYTMPQGSGGYYPLNTFNGEHAPEITVSPSRGADVLARDIYKRLIIPGDELCKVVLERIKDHENYERMSVNTALRVAKAFGGEVSNQSGTSVRLYGEDFYGDFQISGSRTTVELRRVPVELAEKIGALVREHLDKRAQS